MIRRARMLSIVSVISVSYRENGGELNVEDIQQMNIHQLNDIVLSMLDELIRGKDSDKESRKVFDKVSAYIRENFADVNLGAGYITEKFHMSYSYLTGIFKRYAGESIPDYIHKVRIEAAKELLGNGQTVTRAAERVGYADARGFIRAFKKYEGMTPGQYRIQ